MLSQREYFKCLGKQATHPQPPSLHTSPCICVCIDHTIQIRNDKVPNPPRRPPQCVLCQPQVLQLSKVAPNRASVSPCLTDLRDPLIPTSQLSKSKAFSRPQAVMRTWEESKGWRLQSITDRTPAHSIHPIDLFGLNFPETKFSLGSFPTKKKLDGIYPWSHSSLLLLYFSWVCAAVPWKYSSE